MWYVMQVRVVWAVYKVATCMYTVPILLHVLTEIWDV